MMLDRDIHLSKALVIDPNPTSRSILVAQLRDFGIGTVSQCGRVADARSQLESRPFDIVLCENNFAGNDAAGQQLLDDLRRHQLLPLSTVFIMISGEATYNKVAEAAESALDSFLIKPHTASALGDRLLHARRRKRVLKQIFEAVDEGRFDDAAGLCIKRFQERGEFWLFAARIGAELLLSSGRHREAWELYEAVIKAQALPWARLGVARAQEDGNEPNKALSTLESLIEDQPNFVDAYDVMGRIHLDQGNLEEAASVLLRAASLTPDSVGRLQKLGILSFYLQRYDDALRSLERAVSIGINSKMFDPQTLVLLAFLRWRQSDTKGLQRCAENLEHAISHAPDSQRLRRFGGVVRALELALRLQHNDALQGIADLALEVREASFDLEAASNMLALLSRLVDAGYAIEEAEAWVDAIGLRHCSSKALTELLARAAGPHPPFVERIRLCQHRVLEVSEAAMAYSIAGDPGSAVRTLLENGRASLNAKLIDTARLVLQRHHDKIAGADDLKATIEDLRLRYLSVAGKLPIGDGPGRKAGGLALRSAVANALGAEPEALAAAPAAA
ncbi:response regulator [Rubrivivax gelatinosus]|nr:response regulator [Rubrivivax gelatinosus]